MSSSQITFAAHPPNLAIWRECMPKNPPQCPITSKAENALKRSGFAVSSTVPKNPLRLILARSPFFEDGTLKLCWLLDTLECGHQQIIFNLGLDFPAKRHRCAECAQTKSNQFVADTSISAASGAAPWTPTAAPVLIPKKPSASVRLGKKAGAK